MYHLLFTGKNLYKPYYRFPALEPVKRSYNLLLEISANIYLYCTAKFINGDREIILLFCTSGYDMYVLF